MLAKLNDTKPVTINLTSREKECLYWAAMGKSSEETAMILNIKKTTVNAYRNQLKLKLNCTNMTQVVYKAFKFQYLA